MTERERFEAWFFARYPYLPPDSLFEQPMYGAWQAAIRDCIPKSVIEARIAELKGASWYTEANDNAAVERVRELERLLKAPSP